MRPTTSSSRRPPSPTSSQSSQSPGALTAAKLDPVFLCMSRLKRRRFDDVISSCSTLLESAPLDKAIWLMKLQALTAKSYIDDSELEEEGLADAVMDENSIQKAPRPGTSLKRPTTSASGSGPNQSIRPVSSSGRPLSGFARPSTQSRQITASGGRISTAQGSRPMSVAGRLVRLGTASMASSGGNFFDSANLNCTKYAKRPEARHIINYLMHHEKNYKKALELASEATQASEFKDWYWKNKLGKIYYQLGLYRDAEKQLKSTFKHQEMIDSYLALCKIYLRLDQPLTALEYYQKGSEKFPGCTSLILGIARVHDQLNDVPRSVSYYKKILHFDNSNVEAMACLASHHFYSDQPEIALRFYRRLLQMGVSNPEIWNNVALSCFYASQYDMTLMCFERALQLAEDDNMADIWYNIGQIAIGIGDLNLSYQAFKIAISVDANHAESFNNLGILELRKGNIEQARSHFQSAYKLAPHMFEPFFNAALVSFKLGDCQESFEMVSKALEAFPEHTDSKELIKQLKKHFTML